MSSKDSKERKESKEEKKKVAQESVDYFDDLDHTSEEEKKKWAAKGKVRVCLNGYKRSHETEDCCVMDRFYLMRKMRMPLRILLSRSRYLRNMSMIHPHFKPCKHLRKPRM